MASPSLSQVTDKLSDLSEQNFYSPYDRLEFPKSLRNEQDQHWFFAPELISVFGMPEYEALSEPKKKQLSFYEAINFFSINIHGEKSLMEGLAERLYEKNNEGTSRYL